MASELFDIDVERHVIGAMMVDGTADALEILSPAVFHLDRHALIFEALASLFAQKKPCDIISIADELSKSGNLEKVGGKEYLAQISSEVIHSWNLKEHAEIILDRYKRRTLIKVISSIESASDLRKPIMETVASIEAALSDISATGEKKGLIPIRDVIASAAEGWKEIVEGKQYGLKTGLIEIDDYLKGLAPGRFTVIASPPGVGKSALALQIALNCGGKVAFYPLEMLSEELIERGVANGGRVKGDDFTEAWSLNKEGPKIALEIGRMATLNIQLCDDVTVTPLRVASQVHRMKQKHGCDLVIVDYLQLMEADGKHGGKTEEVGYVSKALKRLAKNENVHVIAVASLSTKETERRPDKRGMLSDLRQNGDIGYDADTVIFLYRESEYNPKAYKSETFRNVTEAIIRKNRGRKRGTGLLLFQGQHFRFMDLEKESKKAYLDFLEGKITTGDFNE